MLNDAIFLDRDGTINYDPGYISDPSEVKIYPGVADGIYKLKKELGFLIIVISNQSGITRGFFSKKEVDAVNQKINEILLKKNVTIDAFYYCPYHPDFDSPELVKCRKPSPDMIFQAAKEHKIELKKSFLIGDKLSDIEAGNKAGVKTILVKNNLSDKEIIDLKNEFKTPNFVAVDFLDACNFIKQNILEQ